MSKKKNNWKKQKKKDNVLMQKNVQNLLRSHTSAHCVITTWYSKAHGKEDGFMDVPSGLSVMDLETNQINAQDR